MNIKNAQVNFRNGGFYLTQIDIDIHTPASLAQRMVGGGFAIFEDDRWGSKRTIPVNLADVSSIVLSDQEPK